MKTEKMSKGKAEITIENGIFSPSIGGRIYTSVGYKVKNQGGLGPCENEQEVKEHVQSNKEYLIKEGYAPIVIDLRTKISKGDIRNWTEKKETHVMKIIVKWRWNKDHKKIHHRIEWNNHSEFGDMIGKKGYLFCCDWEDKVKKHEIVPVEDTIKSLVKLNELECNFEIEEEYWEWFSNSGARWGILSKADGVYRELIKKHGFEKDWGFTVHKIKDIAKLYKEAKNKKEFISIVKRCMEFHYEVDVRESTLNGDFIEEDYKPGKHNESAENLMKIKRWLKDK